MFALDILNQLQNENGTLLSDGRIYVYYLGRTRLADIYNDVDGQIPLPNPVILDNLGMSEIYLSNAYDYTVVVTDPYGTELFSRDIFTSPLQEGGANARLYEGWDPIVVNNNVNVISAKMANLGVESPLYFAEDSESATIIGISGELGKTYSGIDPIVVNNELNKISANTKTLSAETPLYITDYDDKTVISVQSAVLGVQEPLYFVENSETATVIGIQGSAITPEGTMNESAFGYEDGKITGYNGSGFSAGSNYEAGNYIDIDGNIISVTGLQLSGEYVSGNNETGFYVTSQSGSIIVGENEFLGTQALGVVKSDSGIWLSPNRIELYDGSALNETLTVLDVSALKALSASKLDASAAGNFYTTANESGFVTNSEVTNNYINYSAISGTDGKVTAINGSALSAGLTYSGIDPIVVNNAEAKISANTIEVSGVSPIEIVENNDLLVISANMSGYASNSALSGKLDASAIQTVMTPWQSEMVTSISGYFISANQAGFTRNAECDKDGNRIDLHYATTAIVNEISGALDNKQDTSAMTAYLTKTSADTLYQPIGNYQTAGNYVSASELSAYATTSLVSSVSSTIIGMIPTGEYELVAGAGIELVDDPSEQTTTINVTAQGGNTAVEQAVIDNSATWNSVTSKQDAGDYYSASNPSGFITGVDLTPYQLTADMTAYQSVLTFGYDTADNISAINNSGITMTPSRDLYVKAPLYTGMSGTSAYIACNTQDFATSGELAYISGVVDTTTGDIAYISGVVGDVESLLASI